MSVMLTRLLKGIWFCVSLMANLLRLLWDFASDYHLAQNQPRPLEKKLAICVQINCPEDGLRTNRRGHQAFYLMILPYILWDKTNDSV